MGRKVQAKYGCCHWFSDGKLANDACIDGKRKDRGGKEYISHFEKLVKMMGQI